MIHAYIIDSSVQGMRLDVYLAGTVPDVPSRTFIKRLIEAGQVTVNEQKVKVNFKLLLGHRVSVDMDPEQLAAKAIKAEKIDLDIFYEDDDIVVINKPVGLTVHPASGSHSGTLVNGLMYRFQELSDVNGQVRPGIVHRLDRDTSGLILVAKTNVAHARLARQFEKHVVMKRYVARVQGVVQFDQGVIDVPIERHDKFHDQRQTSEDGGTGGKEAVTLYSVIKRFAKSTVVGLYPKTGRTHQLRVHMKHLGHPILGDEKYYRKESFPRLALHAQSIGFTHPITKNYIEFSCPVPKEFMVEQI